MSSLFSLFFSLLVAVFSGFWLFFAARDTTREFKLADRFRWIVALLSLLILIGISGFLGTILSAAGVLKLPASWEWPAGYVRGVITGADGEHIVPLPSGRVQFYDSQWHFIRGWNVDAFGGDFKVTYFPDGLIDVFTEKGELHYSFTKDGRMIATTRIPPDTFTSLPEGESAVVPTSPLLWVFSSPFLSCGAAAIGCWGLAFLKNRADRAAL